MVIEIILEKTKNTEFIFNTEKEPDPEYLKERWIKHYDEWINFFTYDFNRGKSMNIYFDDLIEHITKSKHWDLLDYIYYKENKKINDFIKRRKEEIKEQKEKKLEKFKEKVIKSIPNFKEVKERKDSDVLLIMNKDKHNFWNIRLNDFTEEQLKILEDSGYKIYYLKNRNPHDKRNVTIGFIKRKMLERQKHN